MWPLDLVSEAKIFSENFEMIKISKVMESIEALLHSYSNSELKKQCLLKNN